MNLKVGDVVWLKSGGPKLIVVDVSEDGTNATVAWGVWEAGPQVWDVNECGFPVACLTTEDPNK